MTRLTGAIVALTLIATQAHAEPARYDTPQSALDAFMASLETRDREGLLTVFGPEAEEVLFSDDPAENRANRNGILRLYKEGYRFQPDGDGVILLLGEDSWPFPIPLARTGEAWAFDLAAGEAEIEAREIGLNELDVIDLLDAYVDLQASYRLEDHDGDGVMEFAAQIIADPGERNGLFWPDGDGFVGPILARAALTGWSDGETDHEPEPFMGYYFTILHGQGADAPGGEMSYIINGNLVAGHALLAVPAEYGVTGVHTFMVSENGIVLEADLGEDTIERADEISLYNPDPDWSPVEE